MDDSGLKLCAYFAGKPNAMHYCGTDSAINSISDCIVSGNCSSLREEYSHFKALYAYLKLYGEKFGLDYFDKKIIEAYWIGNELLEQFDRNDFFTLLDNLESNGAPKLFIYEQREKFEKVNVRFIPHHAFNVTFIGVGNVTGSVEYNIENINNCLIRYGNISNIDDDKVTVNTYKYQIENTILIRKNCEEELGLNKTFFPYVKIGDSVAFHWKDLCNILNDDEKSRLDEYETTIMNDLNENYFKI
ncbi:MAG: DUF6390 family protein [bacterium]